MLITLRLLEQRWGAEAPLAPSLGPSVWMTSPPTSCAALIALISHGGGGDWIPCRTELSHTHADTRAHVYTHTDIQWLGLATLHTFVFPQSHMPAQTFSGYLWFPEKSVSNNSWAETVRLPSLMSRSYCVWLVVVPVSPPAGLSQQTNGDSGSVSALFCQVHPLQCWEGTVWSLQPAVPFFTV